jgi:hypothetical protein
MPARPMAALLRLTTCPGPWRTEGSRRRAAPTWEQAAATDLAPAAPPPAEGNGGNRCGQCACMGSHPTAMVVNRPVLNQVRQGGRSSAWPTGPPRRGIARRTTRPGGVIGRARGWRLAQVDRQGSPAARRGRLTAESSLTVRVANLSGEGAALARPELPAVAVPVAIPRMQTHPAPQPAHLAIIDGLRGPDYDSP